VLCEEKSLTSDLYFVKSVFNCPCYTSKGDLSHCRLYSLAQVEQAQGDQMRILRAAKRQPIKWRAGLGNLPSGITDLYSVIRMTSSAIRCCKAGVAETGNPLRPLSHYGLPGITMSPLAPQLTVVTEPFELLMMYQRPSDGRHTAMSALPSPS
jgi:hypothetical protein